PQPPAVGPPASRRPSPAEARALIRTQFRIALRTRAVVLTAAAAFAAPVVLTGLIAAGAFAAFVSTSCGIVVALAGTLSQCLRRRGPGPAPRP
ncbi:hypothetical protein E1266_30590, partial [Actinomadura sp. 7K534]